MHQGRASYGEAPCSNKGNFVVRRAVAFLTIVLAALFASSSLSIAQAQQFGRGINANTWFTWPRFKGFDRPGVLWPAFPSNRRLPQAQDFTQIKAMGFTTVRMAVDPALFMGLTADKSWRIRQVMETSVHQALDAGLSVIFDLHPNSRHKIYGERALLAAGDSGNFKPYTDAVANVAASLAKFPNGRVALELVNEPRFSCTGSGQERWHEFLDAMVRAASESAPDLPLVISGSCISSIEGLVALDPSRWKRPGLFFTFHFYEPFPFTHQGAPFIAWPEKYLSGLPWPSAKGADARAILAATASRLQKMKAGDKLRAQAGAASVLDKYLAGTSGSDSIRARFDIVASWADRHRIARSSILIGEFGVYGGDSRGPGANCEDRVGWVRDVRSAAEEYGFAWVFFHLDGPFGVLTEPSRKPNQAMLSALGLAGGAKC